MGSSPGPPMIESRRIYPGKNETPEVKVVDNSISLVKGSTKKGNEPGFDELQIFTSLNKTARTMSSMLMAANSVRAAACEGESNYASGENEKKLTISTQILQEDSTCKEKMEQIHTKWEELLSCKAPQELAQHISEQCQACDALLESKRSLIKAIHGELKAVDEDYHRMFRQQSKDVDILVLSMGAQVINLHNTHIEELSTIEADFMAQRKDLMLRNKAEIDALLKKVRTTECSLKVDLTKRIEDYTKSLENIRTQDNEDYNLLKIRLETDVQILEQHLESMAAAYQLNTEKLDYNYAVLVERDHDNYITAGQQKRKLTKQRDTVCTLKTRHNDFEKRFLLQNAKLAGDYEKVIRLLQDLQSKEHQLEAAQQKQYWEFVRMHHHSLAVLAKRLLHADKKIHEEQLGWVWSPPPRDIDTFFVSSCERKGKTEPDQTQSTSCQAPCGMKKDDVPALHLHEQLQREESSGNDSVRSSQHLLAIVKGKVDVPSIKEIEKVWRSYSDLVAPKVLHVWASLAVAMVSYNQLLKNRAKIMHEVFYLSQQRKIFQGALNHCLSSKATKRH
ncbi:hypothetical protein GOP47_0027246 [Adiantum capillus-veneris]|nr:hypothetical protein GOP47_0030800 [Adiantum capillus-veneris]KAI5057231.1 hypothetical protein GOP47_0027246 [Adiantum capillus-veneris]